MMDRAGFLCSLAALALTRRAPGGLDVSQTAKRLAAYPYTLSVYIDIPFKNPLPCAAVGVETLGSQQVLMCSEEASAMALAVGDVLAMLASRPPQMPVYLRPLKAQQPTPLYYIGTRVLNGQTVVALAHL